MRKGGIDSKKDAPRMERAQKAAPSVGEASRAGAKCGRASGVIGDVAGRSRLFVGFFGVLVAKRLS